MWLGAATPTTRMDGMGFLSWMRAGTGGARWARRGGDLRGG
jgi:hypothetical protein